MVVCEDVVIEFLCTEFDFKVGFGTVLNNLNFLYSLHLCLFDGEE